MEKEEKDSILQLLSALEEKKSEDGLFLVGNAVAETKQESYPPQMLTIEATLIIAEINKYLQLPGLNNILNGTLTHELTPRMSPKQIEELIVGVKNFIFTKTKR